MQNSRPPQQKPRFEQNQFKRKPSAKVENTEGRTNFRNNVLVGLGAILFLVLFVLWQAYKNRPFSPDNLPSTVRMLFIGTHIVTDNDFPTMLTKLVESSGRSIEIETLVTPNGTLADQLNLEATQAKIKEDWTFVVLQENPSAFIARERLNSETKTAVEAYTKLIRRAGAYPILYLPWGRKLGMPEARITDFHTMQTRMTGYLVDLNDLTLKLPIVPVGAGWLRAVSDRPSLDLWTFQGIDANEKGSYLTACIFYATIYRETPGGLGYTAGLSASDASYLQEMAGRIVLENPDMWGLTR